jgi:hypothetical protein
VIPIRIFMRTERTEHAIFAIRIAKMISDTLIHVIANGNQATVIARMILIGILMITHHSAANVATVIPIRIFMRTERTEHAIFAIRIAKMVSDILIHVIANGNQATVIARMILIGISMSTHCFAANVTVVIPIFIRTYAHKAVHARLAISIAHMIAVGIRVFANFSSAHIAKMIKIRILARAQNLTANIAVMIIVCIVTRLKVHAATVIAQMVRIIARIQMHAKDCIARIIAEMILIQIFMHTE